MVIYSDQTIFEEGREYEVRKAMIGVLVREILVGFASNPGFELNKQRYDALLLNVERVEKLIDTYAPFGDHIANATLGMARDTLNRLGRLVGLSE